MTKVRELYEFWGAESYAALEAELGDSLDPRGRDWLFELFASLGPGAGDVVLDIGARDGKHLRRLVEEHGVEGIALDPVPQADDVLEGTLAASPPALLDLIGDTPLVELPRLAPKRGRPALREARGRRTRPARSRTASRWR